MSENYDVVVIGGGPAGSACSALLAREGFKILQLEQHKFPRFHIGESITAFGADAFKKLGVYEDLKAVNYVQKKGLEFVEHEKSRKVYFPQSARNEPTGLPWAFQMARAKLDSVLLENARRNGVTVLEQHRVMKVLFDGDTAVGIEYKDVSNGRNGELKTAHARWIIDASGQGGVINRLLKDNCFNDYLLREKVAVFCHWKGDIEVTNNDDDLNFKLCVHKNRRIWAWYIPVEKDTLSLGIVFDREALKNRNKGLDEFFYEYAKDIPFISDLVKNPALKTTMKFHSVKDYSYRSKNYYGKGWALVGDSAGFIDPVFSTGLMITFNSAFKLVDVLTEALREEKPDYSRFKDYGEELDKYYRINSTLVYLFYLSELDYSKFGNIWYLWKHVTWANARFRTLFLWYSARLWASSTERRAEWFGDVLFGKVRKGNLMAKWFLSLAENFEDIHQAKIKNAGPRQGFIELET